LREEKLLCQLPAERVFFFFRREVTMNDFEFYDDWNVTEERASFERLSRYLAKEMPKEINRTEAFVEGAIWARESIFMPLLDRAHQKLGDVLEFLENIDDAMWDVAHDPQTRSPRTVLLDLAHEARQLRKVIDGSSKGS
jgi:hypothetical protein